MTDKPKRWTQEEWHSENMHKFPLGSGSRHAFSANEPYIDHLEARIAELEDCEFVKKVYHSATTGEGHRIKCPVRLSETEEKLVKAVIYPEQLIPHGYESIEDCYVIITKLREALESIEKNSCCNPCREAGLVARTALRECFGNNSKSAIKEDL